MKPKPEDAEREFARYLTNYRIEYSREYVVDTATGSNVDFRIKMGNKSILLDVKVVVDVPRPPSGEIIAHRQIASDIQKLRKKFRSDSPKHPVILVTVNHSSMFFTGFTLLRAMFGKAKVDFAVPDMAQLTPLRFFPNGGARFTLDQNTGISGILVFNPRSTNVFFANPFAKYPVKEDCFPNTKAYQPTRTLTGSEILEFSNLQFDGYYSSAG
jgi:hypothetical protein